MDVVVVESPAKAKTINKYLGDDYIVLASYGHVRDLPSKDGSVVPDDDFAMTYVTDDKSAKHVKAIADAMRGSDKLFLATDPDREGEAISWHVMKALADDYGMRDIPAKRVVFNEITKKAVVDGINNPRDLDMDLINAQQARRALDYLVGFTLSPVLWRKLPGAKSAGRVQSVALRLICEREIEIEAFRPREYWSVEVDFKTAADALLIGRLTHLNGVKLARFSIADGEAAEAAKRTLEVGKFSIAKVETKPTKRNPAPPFTTATLQQEASRKLGFGAKRTMQIAQRLYEGFDIGGETVGLITYMRTDGVQMANEAISASRDVIDQEFGADYVPGQARVYRSKAKNAQEAHEAIRPTDFSRLPRDMEVYLDSEQQRLYDLIWKRAMASQMESARLSRTTVEIAAHDGSSDLRTTGTVVDFPGFLKLYEEGRDEKKAGDDDERRLPKVAEGEALSNEKVRPEQHFTEPPPRYSEATLVKKLEELGIGRPSTYASILTVLQDRNYVVLDRKRFMPEDSGRLVTAFLESYFHRYVEYDFTADLEGRLDSVSAGDVDWKVVLRDFWRDFSNAVEDTSELRVREVLDKVNDMLAPHLYPDGGVDRICPACKKGSLNLRGGRNGFFLGCDAYPECHYTRAMKQAEEGDADEMFAAGPIPLGDDPESGMHLTLRKGPYGLYIQLGEAVEGDKKKKRPKRAGMPADVTIEQLDLELAQKIIQLPRLVGEHPDTGKSIFAGIGRFGPYVMSEARYFKLESTADALSIGLNHAVAVIADGLAKGGGRRGANTIRTIGEHPDGGDVKILDGRFGAYIKYKKLNATLPKTTDPMEMSMQDALELLQAKAEKAGQKPTKAKAKPKAKAKAKAKPKAKKAAPASSEAVAGSSD
ncbi:MAG: type I DNA topoisomerase [Alphaproteobacteria bacterium]|jgi:DNA topoisomerase-1|nr:type I DNA topoisomerase [Alphaproteobacteria bacterium]MDP7056663.1 type I DNA topoisomerase [Alphaproteobacteria bacterium]MDP7230380.1 type I DNA topoisomerase [Alphaproteobacteria bacterium]MDP7460444.1 type I DNA topoisomerase [Alphaproteobacteria bacterium]HJM94410.1 type I DNA topoisomerase [Alphaproteobacteria bacterium]|tara:strand:- start:22 stop:2658 length:2637 start_codon:yes stop_codon:yes gene_type:complete